MRFDRSNRLGWGLALLLALGATGASAQEAQSCDSWLPDLTCDRSGRWDGFEKPIVHPYLFEDPFITTGVYPYYLFHEFPDRSALGGGHAHAAAVQLRVALTDRLAFIATKDGRVWERPENPLLDDKNGWMNLAGGLKYVFIQDREAQFILGGALRAEFSTGSSDIFEGGSGFQILPSVSAAWGLGDLHLIGGLGGKISASGDDYGNQVFYHFYTDYKIHERFQPFIQLSGIYYVSSGDGKRGVNLKNGPTISLDTAQHALRTGHFEGVDLHNLGSAGVDNNNYLTWAIGTHIPITDHVTWSFAYERPLTGRKDITKQRVTTALMLEF